MEHQAARLYFMNSDFVLKNTNLTIFKIYLGHKNNNFPK